MAARLPMAPWYAEGIRFECQRSGKCCTNHGEYAYVYVTEDETVAMAAHLGLELPAFRRRYTTRVEGQRVLRSRSEACIFLDGADCSVHTVKPKQCAAWPFWSDNLDPQVWANEVAPFCPGVGRGRLYGREEIEAIVASAAPAEE